jgi:hypothetical protein
MAPKDYVDPEGYWADPERNIRRMGDEDGEQMIILKATEVCSDEEWRRICELFRNPQN